MHLFLIKILCKYIWKLGAAPRHPDKLLMQAPAAAKVMHL